MECPGINLHVESYRVIWTRVLPPTRVGESHPRAMLGRFRFKPFLELLHGLDYRDLEIAVRTGLWADLDVT